MRVALPRRGKVTSVLINGSWNFPERCNEIRCSPQKQSRVLQFPRLERLTCYPIPRTNYDAAYRPLDLQIPKGLTVPQLSLQKLRRSRVRSLTDRPVTGRGTLQKIQSPIRAAGDKRSSGRLPARSKKQGKLEQTVADEK